MHVRSKTPNSRVANKDMSTRIIKPAKWVVDSVQHHFRAKFLHSSIWIKNLAWAKCHFCRQGLNCKPSFSATHGRPVRLLKPFRQNDKKNFFSSFCQRTYTNIRPIRTLFFTFLLTLSLFLTRAHTHASACTHTHTLSHTHSVAHTKSFPLKDIRLPLSFSLSVNTWVSIRMVAEVLAYIFTRLISLHGGTSRSWVTRNPD